jgi:cytosine deaminase
MTGTAHADRSPGDREGGTFAAVGLATRADVVFNLSIRAAKIAALEPCAGPARWMLLPPLADLHVHANRAYTLGSTSPTSFEHALELAHEQFRDFAAEDYARQARRLFATCLAHGTTRLRTHADLDPVSGLAAVHGTLEARDAFTGKLDVEIVAFASAAYDPVQTQATAALCEAYRLGATLLGAVPALYPDPQRSIDALLDLAAELGAAVDVHLDEHLDARRSCSSYLAAATRSRGLEGRVTLSHGCAISVLPAEECKRVAEELAAARITVVCLPTTNLYLQDRHHGAPQRRGLAPLRELARAGVALRFASDNVRDVFYPYGSADLLEIAQLIATAGQLEDPRLLVQGICAGCDRVSVGAEASFVLVRGESLAEILAERATERIVIHHGLRQP